MRMKRINTETSAQWNNIKRKAAHPKDVFEQAAVNMVVLEYIRRLQMQVDELKNMLEDDGR